MQHFFVLLMCLSFVAPISCKSKVPSEKPNPGEKLVWSTTKERPQWTYREVGLDGEQALLTAMSDKFSTEKYARDDAMQAARKKAVQYSSARVKDMVQNAVEQSGLASDIFDPLRVQRDYETQLSQGGISKLKSRSLYIEKWPDSAQTVYFRAFVLAEIPKSVLDESLARVLKQETDRLSSADGGRKQQIDSLRARLDQIQKAGLSVE